MSEPPGYKSDALQVVFRPVEALVPYARNARTHSDEQVAQIAASIEEFGFTNPVLADERGIVAGHGRVLAARKLYAAGRVLKTPSGLPIPEGAVPVLDCSGWSEAQRKAYVLADNQLALNAGWNFELLKIELEELKAEGFDLPLIGFDDEALKRLLAPPIAGDAEGEEADEEPDDECRIIQCPKCGHDFSVLEQMTTQARRRKKAQP